MTTVQIKLSLTSKEYTWASHVIKNNYGEMNDSSNTKQGLADMLESFKEISLTDYKARLSNGENTTIEIPVALNVLNELTAYALENDIELKDLMRLTIIHQTELGLEDLKERERLRKQIAIGQRASFTIANKDYERFTELFGNYREGNAADLKRFNNDVYKVFKRGLEAMEE